MRILKIAGQDPNEFVLLLFMQRSQGVKDVHCAGIWKERVG